LKRAARWTGYACWVFLTITQAVGAHRSLVHKPAPQFVRRDLNGETISLRAYRGKVVLLNFWATWCAPCQQELPRFAAWQRQYGADNFQVVSISMDDDAAPVRALASKLQLGFPVVMGDATIGRRYGGVLGLPVTFLITRDGVVAAHYVGEVRLGELKKQLRQLLQGH